MIGLQWGIDGHYVEFQKFFLGESLIVDRFVQIGPDILRLHLNGGVVGERITDYLNGNGVDLSSILLSGGDGSTENSVQGYAHYVRVLPQPTVTNHYVKVCRIHEKFMSIII